MWNNWVQVLTRIVQQHHSHIKTKRISPEILFLFSNKDYSNYPYWNGSPFWRQTQKSHVFLRTQHKKLKSALVEWLFQKLLSVRIDNKLTFEPHVRSLCKKASQELNAFSRIACSLKFKQKKTLNVLITSNISYASLVWMFHN